MFHIETFRVIIEFMSYFAVAVSHRRAVEWERMFGETRVPILQGRPRWIEFRDGSEWGYDVDLGRLHWGQISRLAAYVSRVQRVGYVMALRLVNEGVTIRADGVVIETADVVEHRPFVFRSDVWRRERAEPAALRIVQALR